MTTSQESADIISRYKKTTEELETQLLRALGRNQRLFDALTLYGEHLPTCKLRLVAVEPLCGCDCGLVEAMTKVDAVEEDTSETMTVYPHYWQDDGVWEFDANGWKPGIKPVEMPRALVEKYKACLATLASLSGRIRSLAL